MRNITISLDDEIYHRAEIAAEALNCSVSQLVKRYLDELAGSNPDAERLQQMELEIRAQIKNFSASDRLSRDELYDGFL